MTHRRVNEESALHRLLNTADALRDGEWLDGIRDQSPMRAANGQSDLHSAMNELWSLNAGTLRPITFFSVLQDLPPKRLRSHNATTSSRSENQDCIGRTTARGHDAEDRLPGSDSEQYYGSTSAQCANPVS